MREVHASRFVRAKPLEVERAVSPADVIKYEGTFDVRAVEETDDGWIVTVTAGGLEMNLAFEEHDDGLRYEQRGDAGPFESMQTTVTMTPKDDGVRVEMRSAVSLGLPIESITDRIAAWKRRGELKRALERLAARVE